MTTEVKDAELLSQEVRLWDWAVGGVLHEVGTPLQYIGDNLRFLGERWDDLRSAPPGPDADGVAAAIEDGVAAIAESLQGLQRIVDCLEGLRHLSGAPVGPRRQESIDVGACLERVANLSRPRWQSIARLELRVDPALPLVRGDRAALLRGLLQLMGAAIEPVAQAAGRGGAPGGLELSARNLGSGVRLDVVARPPGAAEPPPVGEGALLGAGDRGAAGQAPPGLGVARRGIGAVDGGRLLLRGPWCEATIASLRATLWLPAERGQADGSAPC